MYPPSVSRDDRIKKKRSVLTSTRVNGQLIVGARRGDSMPLYGESERRGGTGVAKREAVGVIMMRH